jgi:hypothetical protein
MEKPFVRSLKMIRRIHRNGYLFWIATKCSNIFLNPLHGCALVKQAIIPDAWWGDSFVSSGCERNPKIPKR